MRRLFFSSSRVLTFLRLAVAVGVMLGLGTEVRGDVMLQYFNTNWAEISAKMPELAEAGYTSIWLPPPTKGSGGLSVGYDLWDRFDLGSKDQRGSVSTRYGTEGELLRLVEIAHRFGIRIIFDNIMNHNAFDVPGYNAETPIDTYPGFVPEDFHLRKTEDGFYRKWDNTRNWGDAWQVQNLGLADLIDIAHETPNTNFGAAEGDDMQKISFVRQPDPRDAQTKNVSASNSAYYLDLGLPHTASGGSFTVYSFSNKEPYQDVGYANTISGATIGAGNGKFDFQDNNGNGQHDSGEPGEPFTDSGDPAHPGDAEWGAGNGRYDMGDPIVEDVNALLIRSARWELDRTKADGLRLDAVKHVPDYFFGKQSGGDKDKSSDGYLGQSQEQFNITRGFTDWDNHRDSVFNTEQGRDDAMMFGEHLGQPPGYGGYWDAGMRLVDNDLRQQLNDKLGSPYNGLQGFDQPGAGGFSPSLGVMHAQSHDNDYASRRELQHAMYFTRAGIGLLYTDGNHHALTLGESGGAFPRHANTAFLGQWGDLRVPNLLYIHNQFARGDQRGRWSDADFVAYERIDKRENGSMSDADGATMLIALNDNYSSSQGRTFTTSFPAGAYLWQYSAAGNYSGYATVGGDGKIFVEVPAGGYQVYSWKNPDSAPGLPGIRILQNGQPTGTMTYERADGPDGDPNFNPNGVAGDTAGDYKYTWTIPRVTSGANLSFLASADGSAQDIMMKLDGGADINSQMGNNFPGHPGGDPRDNPPAISTDTFLGYEKTQFVRRSFPEMFAAAVTATRNTTNSPGAETYTTSGVLANGANNKLAGSGNDAVDFVYHDPTQPIEGAAGNQFDGTRLWAKTNSGLPSGYQAFVYFANGGANPEGAAGQGDTVTTVVPMEFKHDAGGGSWWWTPSPLPPEFIAGSSRYKIGVFKNAAASVFPANAGAVAKKSRMATLFSVNNFNAATRVIRPHNDYGESRTGLSEGFHFIQARAFLDRGGRASIYNTFQQTFYYDTQTPAAQIQFPANNGDSVGGSQYGVVVRGDESVTEVWYHIDDGGANTANDDENIKTQNGNGAGPEPFTDSNSNGIHDATELFTDINGNGVFDANLSETWTKATEVTPTAGSPAANLGREWRFNYTNIPASGTGTIKVRLLELSSSRNMTLSASAAHVTELTRTVNLAGPLYQMFVAFPQQNGQVVGAGYVMKVRFSDALAQGTTEPELRARFKVSIASSESGSTAGAVEQSAQSLTINYNTAPGFHDFQFALPNFYNGVPDFIHTIIVDYNGTPALTTTRQVKAQPGAVAAYVNVTNPIEVDSDGKPFQIVLPNVPAADLIAHPEYRQYPIQVETDLNVLNLQIAFDAGTGTIVPDPDKPNTTVANRKYWNFLWTNMTEGSFHFTAKADTDGNIGTVEGSAGRGATVIFRELTAAGEPFQDLDNDGVRDTGEPFTDLNGNGVYDAPDSDNDDDGLPNTVETTITPLPLANAETWTDGNVHLNAISGKSNPLSPDSDGDGLPDGLESGWRTAANPPTNPAANTNGDAYPNFIGDLDPPFYNTVPDNNGLPNYNFNDSRTKLIDGSTTNPSDPDSDDDGIMDGVEDANHNGWVDGDGAALGTTQAANTRTAWPNGKRDNGETWTETDPNNPDTDGDGLQDGYGEDRNGDGRIAGDTNNNRVYDSGESWTETDPLNKDTDGDGLPDGWEVQNGLDPLDNGTTNMRTGETGSANNGASGDPDGDGFSNLLELTNGTNPKLAENAPPPAVGTITIGPVSGSAMKTVGAVVNAKEFTDWSLNDLIVLDEYDGDGSNYQQSDVYHAYDGFDSSRDLNAFYAHDGGAADGNFYFRVDLADLKAFAEEGNLDIYVVIDFGSPATGEYALPDDVDTGTEMRWEAVVACYSSNNGRVYIDTDHANNSTSIGQSLSVQVRDQNSVNGFKKAYFNSNLDSVEFSISRQALLDAGWNGNAAALNYQVFTTRDGTKNSPVGAGDIGGRSDIRDSIYDDRIASDYYKDQTDIAGAKSVLQSWFSTRPNEVPGKGSNDRGKRAKVIELVHGNQAIQPGNVMQSGINTNAGAGWYRPFDAHDAFDAPMALHMTPVMASALQWAKSAASPTDVRRDGSRFNTRIANLRTTGVIDLLGSTFSDHILPYFPAAFTADNVELADEFLFKIYGAHPSSSVLWLPERVADADTFGKILTAGFEYTFVDQLRHVLKWFGRQEALGANGYRINTINGVNTFVINDDANASRFRNDDNGLATPLRQLLSRKARNNQQDQVVVLFHDLDEFKTKANADAYDVNLRWMANHPWIQLVTPDQIANGQVDLSQPPDGTGDAWGTVARGTSGALAKVAHDFIDHASEENYDNWYNGSSFEESLSGKQFNIRTGVQLGVGQEFGQVGVSGVSNSAWSLVSTLPAPSSAFAQLARGTLHSAMFVTAFHNNTNNDLSKFSTGAYLYPDTTFQNLAAFAKVAQSQARRAAIYKRVQDWAAVAGTLTASSTAAAEDADLDGENECLLFNDRVFAVFEKLGGRAIAAWVRDIDTGEVIQTIGNPLSYSGSETEEEGAANILSGQVGAYRTSAFKDWYAAGPDINYVNDLYAAVAISNGWQFTSSDGKIVKKITLAPRATTLVANYTFPPVTGPVTTLFVRNGLSPNLHDLLIHGQNNLSSSNDAGKGEFNAVNVASKTVRTFVKYGGTGFTANYNAAAVDRDNGVTFDTANMRNQAQTQQVEISGGNGMTFAVGLQTGVTVSSDADGDGLPDGFEKKYGLDANSGAGNNGANGDGDGDGRSNMLELLLGTNPSVADTAAWTQTTTRNPDGSVTIAFPTLLDRSYRILYTDNLSTGFVPANEFAAGTGSPQTWTDTGAAGRPHPGSVPARFYKIEVQLNLP